MENSLINPWIVKTGAICATALIFLATNDHEVASWFRTPEPVKLIEGISHIVELLLLIATVFFDYFEEIRPTDLTLMTIAQYMIMWDSIEPTTKWLDSLKPKVVLENALSRKSMSDWSQYQMSLSDRSSRNSHFGMFQDTLDLSVTATADLSIDVGAAFVLG